MIFFGEDSLRLAIQHFILHYHFARNHQGLGNRLIVPIGAIGESMGSVQRRERLGVELLLPRRRLTKCKNDPMSVQIEFLDTTTSTAPIRIR